MTRRGEEMATAQPSLFITVASWLRKHGKVCTEPVLRHPTVAQAVQHSNTCNPCMCTLVHWTLRRDASDHS